MTLEPTDIKAFLTGGSSNTNPNASLGGNVSSTTIQDNVLHNLFRRVTDSEASSGITLYRCIAVKNTDGVDTMRNVVFYFVIDTTSNDDFALYSKAQAAKNSVETAIANEFTAPTGSNINFIASLNRDNGLKLGNLGPGEFINVWLKIVVNPGAAPFPDNKFKFRIEVDPQGNPPPPAPDPGGGTGSNFQIAALGDCSCSSDFDANLSKIKGRSPGFVIFNGDDAYKSGSQCFVDKTASLRSKSGTTFGNHDVDESESQPSTKNALLNAWGYSKTYNKKVVGNFIGILFMESGENQSVSDSVGSSQYNFVEDTLKAWDADPSIEWIIVCNHYPFYGPDSNHNNNSGGRDRYHPLFDKYGVDIVITSHNHNLWSTKLLKYNSGSPSNPTTAGTDPNYSYSKSASNHGAIFLGSGGGGKSHYSANSVSYTPFVNDSKYGYLFLDFVNSGKKINIKFYDSSDNTLKTITLTHT